MNRGFRALGAQRAPLRVPAGFRIEGSYLEGRGLRKSLISRVIIGVTPFRGSFKGLNTARVSWV